MEISIVLAVILFVFNALSKAAKQKQKQNQAKPAKPKVVQRTNTRIPSAPLSPSSQLGGMPGGGFANLLYKLGLEEIAPEPAPAPIEVVVDEGMTMTVDYGDIAGSMPYDSPEGEEPLGHQHGLNEGAQGNAQTRENQVARQAPGKLNASQMKNAVILAEVLGRPVSMRRR